RTTAVVTTSSIYLICGDTCCTTCIQGNGDVLTYSDGRGIVYDRYLLRTGRGITSSIYRGIGHCSCTKSKSCWRIIHDRRRATVITASCRTNRWTRRIATPWVSSHCDIRRTGNARICAILNRYLLGTGRGIACSIGSRVGNCGCTKSKGCRCVVRDRRRATVVRGGRCPDTWL